MLKYWHYLVYSLLLISCKNELQPASGEISISENWEFKGSNHHPNWQEARVPGCVHTDLIRLNKIEDPFYRMNEHELQWIDKQDWEYKTSFVITDDIIKHQNLELCFQGIDTYSKIYLNDTLIASTDNMFRSYSLDIKKLVKTGPNVLRIILESPINRGLEKFDSLGYQLPVSDNDLADIGKVEGEKQVSIFSRKAGYHFGWDWGPRLVSSGIWKPVVLRYWNSHRIKDLYIKQTLLDSTAIMEAELLIESNSNQEKASIDILVNGESANQKITSLSEGINKVRIPFQINNPQLWWPQGYGEQPLYEIEAKVSCKEYQDQVTTEIGLRTIQLVRENDQYGKSFYFEVNGQPMFMKGANYIPQDVFLDRVDTADYNFIIESAIKANMNMLRVWGGGVYESDYFYELCDKNGILIWQDFMFACAMFPGDQDFLENVRQEATEQVVRLRNHPSIALWCGNNEILSAWENWGWKPKVIEEQSQQIADTIWYAYDAIFHNVLPEVVKEYNGERVYWPSSPGSDFGKKESFESGDVHYWMVWWGKQPFSSYKEAIPRFMSEYGFQSFPIFSSVKNYTDTSDYDVYSPVMKSHQRSSIGNVTIEEYMIRHYIKPKKFEHYLYVSQLLQAKGIKTAIEAHRQNRHRCMGTLYWQINDCWPVASWSGIDYYGRWKALHYTVKNSFRTFLITMENANDSLNFHVVSDSLNNLQAELKIELLDFKGKILNQSISTVDVQGNSTNKYVQLASKTFLGNSDSTSSVIRVSLRSKSKVYTDNIFFLAEPKSLKLTQPDIKFEIIENPSNYEILLETDLLAKNIYLETEWNGNFSDNFFDLIPGQKKSILLFKSNDMSIDKLRKGLQIYSLVDCY